jgi:hypothetical protein
MCDVASCWIYEYIGILLGARPILHISRIKVIYRFIVCRLKPLNMFQASLCPASGAYRLQQQPLDYRRNVVVFVLLVVVVPDRPRTTALLPPYSIGKPVAAAFDRLLMMGTRIPEIY